MTKKISELLPREINELHCFLRKGLGESSASLNEDVLMWKYFGRHDLDRPVSFIMRDANGDICAHVGATYAQFVLEDRKDKPLRAMFPTDWLSTQPGAGLKLVTVALADNPILYAIGGTHDADRALRAVRCKQVGSLSLMRRFPGSRGALSHAFRSGGNCLRKAARAVRDTMQSLAPLAESNMQLQLSRITRFVEADIIQNHTNDIHTLSSINQLNHLLQHPRGVISGWRINHSGSTIGYALLSVLPDPVPVRGKIIECQLVTGDPRLGASLVAVLTKQLNVLGASVATSLVSTPFMQNAFEANNYHRCGASNLLVRSPLRQLFESSPIMLSLREGDISYV